MTDEIKLKSADDIIVREEAAKLGKPLADSPKPVEVPKETEGISDSEVSLDIKAPDKEVKEEVQAVTEENTQEPQSVDGEDEYGTKIETKKKLYTEDEVQRMIRERLKRGSHPEQQEQIKEAAKDFKADPNSEENWEVQLAQFVEKTVDNISKKKAEVEWREHQEKNQAEFEIKFTDGMSKYKDFETVVSGKPITGSIMLATRTMNDPAAFIYAVCKQHPKELSRIAEIRDPLVQATEIGRLEERMKRSKAIPASPKPASKISEDVTSDMPQLSIDQRIAAHAKDKIMGKR